MSGFDYVLLALVLGGVAFQVWLTVRVWKNRFYERSQKVLQSQLIWLLPVVGAVLVYSLMPPEEEDPKRKANTHLRG
jgi:hypothetical protein